MGEGKGVHGVYLMARKLRLDPERESTVVRTGVGVQEKAVVPVCTVNGQWGEQDS